MAAEDVALILAQGGVAQLEAVKSGLPIGAATQWGLIAVAYQGISARGGDLDLAGAVALEAPYRQLGVIYGAVDGKSFTAWADALAVWIGVVGAPSVPTAPLNPMALSGDTQITITWEPPAYDGNSAITGYKVTRLDNSAVQTVAGNVLTATFTLLINGNNYSFNVKAVNALGDSIASATVTANPVGISRRYDFGPPGDAPAATWLAAPPLTNVLGTYTDTTDLSFPIEFRSGVYGLDPAGGNGITFPLEEGDWSGQLAGAEFTFNQVGLRSSDIAFVTDSGTVTVARAFDPFAQFGFGTPYTLNFTIRVPAGGHGARLIMPEIADHGFLTAATWTGIPVGSQTLSPDIPPPGGGGGGGGGVGLVPLGNSTSFKSKIFVNTHWRYTNITFYGGGGGPANFTALAVAAFGGNVRDECPGKVIGGDQTIGTRFWQWVVANNLRVIYVSMSSAFGNVSSHAVNRQVMEAVPGAAAHIYAVEAPNEIDFQFSSGAQRQAEIDNFCTAWAGYPLVAPSVGNWPNQAAYDLWLNDTRFTYGNDHSYMGSDYGPTDTKMAQAISLSSRIVGNRPKFSTEHGHGTYAGGIGPDGTTGPNPGNPPLTEDQQADSYLREQLDRDRFGYTAFCLYELGDEYVSPVTYESRLGLFHPDWTDKPSGAAIKRLRAFYSSDPATITNCPVTITGESSITRRNLRQRNGAWLLAMWEQGNTPATKTVTLTFTTSRNVVVSNLRTGAAVSNTTGTVHTVVSSATPVMCVIT